jgi:tRNA1(Val) A37 N6-methylase TrmN6
MIYREDELLIDGRKILQPVDGYHFSSDSVRLAKFVEFKANDRIIELCSGCGIVGILLCLYGASSVQMVELQKELADVCAKNIEINELAEKIKVFNAPLQDCYKTLGSDCFDIVVCNPPFERVDPRFEENQINIAKFEYKVNFEEIAKEAVRLLKTGGKFFFVYPAARLFEAAATLEAHSFQIKKCSLFFPKEIADTVYVMATKGGKPGAKISLLLHNPAD